MGKCEINFGAFVPKWLCVRVDFVWSQKQLISVCLNILCVCGVAPVKHVCMYAFSVTHSHTLTEWSFLCLTTSTPNRSIRIIHFSEQSFIAKRWASIKINAQKCIFDLLMRVLAKHRARTFNVIWFIFGWLSSDSYRKISHPELFSMDVPCSESSSGSES